MKPSLLEQVAGPADVFPLPKGGGSIEARTMAEASQHQEGLARFHCRKAVAPLKHTDCTVDVISNGQHPWFPLPKGGGSIEARRSSGTQSLHGYGGPGFHCRKAVAPLKPFFEPAGRPRGPSRTCFHCRKAVAPLKRHSLLSVNLRLRVGPSCFHCRKAVAPLKLECGGIHGPAPRRGFPLPKGGGSIEAWSTGPPGRHRRSLPSAVSTAERRWLH